MYLREAKTEIYISGLSPFCSDFKKLLIFYIEIKPPEW